MIEPLNWKMISHPMNWVIILLMLIIAGTFGHLLLTYLGIEPSKDNQMGLAQLPPTLSPASSAGVVASVVEPEM